MGAGPLRARAALSTLIVPECLALPVFLSFVYLTMNGKDGWGGVFTGGALVVLIFAWWRAFFVEIRDEELVYRSLLVRKKIKLNDIRSAVRRIDLISRGNRPPNRLEIHAVVNGRHVDFDINMKPFRWEDVKRIETILDAAR